MLRTRLWWFTVAAFLTPLSRLLNSVKRKVEKNSEFFFTHLAPRLGMLRIWFAIFVVMLAVPAYSELVIDQNQPNTQDYMANFSQTNLAQSFKQSANNVAGAGIFIHSGSSIVTISLWDALPGAGGTLLAIGSGAATQGSWIDVFWSPVTVPPDTTLFLVFEDGGLGVSGSIANPYSRGQVYANSGFESYPVYDYAFRTYAEGISDKNLGEPCNGAVGNPVNAGTGNKFSAEVDYVSNSVFPLQIARYYNSQANSASVLGSKWLLNLDRRLSSSGAQNLEVITVQRQDGKRYDFKKINNAWQAEGDVFEKLNELTNSSGIRTGWRLTAADDSVEQYDAGGKLISTANRAGLTHALNYNASNQLQSVSDSFGHVLTFSYDSQNRLSGIIDPLGGTYTYQYNAANNLATVTIPTARYAPTSTTNPHSPPVRISRAPSPASSTKTASVLQPMPMTRKAALSPPSTPVERSG